METEVQNLTTWDLTTYLVPGNSDYQHLILVSQSYWSGGC